MRSRTYAAYAIIQYCILKSIQYKLHIYDIILHFICQRILLHLPLYPNPIDLFLHKKRQLKPPDKFCKFFLALTKPEKVL